MGCGASRQKGSREESVRNQTEQGAGQLVHWSRESYNGVPLVGMYEKIKGELNAEIRERRTTPQAAIQRLREARGAQGLQARGALMSIYATPESVFGDFLADSPEYVDLPTFSFSPVNAMTGSTMLFKATEFQQLVEGGADAALAPNATLLGAPLENILKLKAMWGKSLLAVTLLMFDHPTLGMVTLVQPLLLAACMHRLFNCDPDPDPVFDVLLKAGADPGARNSLNMTALMQVVSSLMGRLESDLGGSIQPDKLAGELAKRVGLASAIVRQLLAAGADPADEMLGFGAAWKTGEGTAYLTSQIRSVRHVLHLERYTVHEALQQMRAVLADRIAAAGPGAGQPLDDLAELLRPRGGRGPAEVAPGEAAVGGADPVQERGEKEQQEPPGGGGSMRQSRRSVRHLTWPWIQAMSNIAWAVSQVTMLRSPRQRRSFLGTHLRRTAAFELPPMSVVSVEQLRREGCIPRYSLGDAPSAPASAPGAPQPAAGSGPGRFRPTPADELPADAVVVFVSHRWLGRGCPDDDQGTKLKQVLAIAAHVAAHRQVPPDQVFLWLDYSVVDQSNPMPGVQALPIYIACCEEFVYVHHEEYWQRAWCLTEQFMHWKLAVSDTKHMLQPSSLKLVAESARERPPDPTFGKLAVEADRVALTTMTSIMPYNIG